MRILILGAGGFIGSHLTKKLTEKGFEIVGIDIKHDKINEDIRDQIELFNVDIRQNKELVERQVSRADAVVDLIAYANPAIYVKSPLDVVELNFFENLKIMEYCLKYDKRLVQFSSCEVYGITHGNTESFDEEETPLIMGPVKYNRWIYACGKQFLERIIHAHGITNNLNYTIIRPFNFIGPKIDYLTDDITRAIPRVFSIYMSALLSDGPLYLVDGGKNKRCFTYIDDAVNAVMIIMENPDEFFNRQICNIGNPENETDMEGLAKLMKEIYEDITGKVSGSVIKIVSGEEFYGEGYQDCDRRIPDISKLQKFGWKPAYSLRETLKMSMSYYLKR